MNERIRMTITIFSLVGCLFLSACGRQRSHPGPLTNPFFAMDTGTDRNNLTAAEQARMINELDYAGIGYTGAKDIPQMLKEMDKYGLNMFTVYLGVRIDDDKQKYDPKLREAIKQLKGRETMLWLTITSARHKPSSPDGDPRAAEIIREIADMAQESGLRVALYPHTNTWLERVEDAVRVAKKVDRKNVGATFNLCHWLRVDDEKNMKSLMELAMPYLFVVTINGADSGGKDWKTLIQTLDRGSFDTCQFVKMLLELGYAGPVGLQHYGIKGNARENLKHSMRAWYKFSERMAAEKK